MRLTLVISSLERGGAERVLSILASAWAKQRRCVSIVVLDRSDLPAYPLHHSIKLCGLGLPPGKSRHFLQAIWRNLRKLRLLRRAVRVSTPDVVISFMNIPNIITLLATRGMGIPVIVTEHVNPESMAIGRLWNILRRITYPLAAALVCPTGSMVASFQKQIKVRGYAIFNPLEAPSTSRKPSERNINRQAGRHTVVAMGRLAPEKGFDLLLEAFSRISELHAHWRLNVVGDGPLKQQLEAQAEALGLQEKVNFMGVFPDPAPVLCDADLFVFSSRFEGFGNALCEAMACGLPAISFDCTAGPSHIIRNGVDGVLVPPEDVAALASAMTRLMDDPEERERLASRAPEVLNRFSKESALLLWEHLFDEVLPRPYSSDRFNARRSSDPLNLRTGDCDRKQRDTHVTNFI